MTRTIKFSIPIFILLLFFDISAQSGVISGIHEVVGMPSSVIFQNDNEVSFDGQSIVDDFYNSSAPLMKYLWSFGDGHTSEDPNPTHIYETSGVYTATMHATPIYAPQPPPPTSRAEVTINNIFTAGSAVQPGGGAFTNSPLKRLKLEINRDIRNPHESSVTITYQNASFGPIISGDIDFMYNASDFDITQIYTYEGETTVGGISSASTNATTGVDGKFRLHFNNLFAGQTRRIIVQVRLKPGVITSNAQDVEANFAAKFADHPNDPQFTGVIESNLTHSWDPNRKDAFIEKIYEGEIPTPVNSMTYRIHFENEGDAPTSNVKINDYIASVLDPISYEVTDQKDDAIDYEVDLNGNVATISFPQLYLLPPSNSGHIEADPNDLEGCKYWVDVTCKFELNELAQALDDSGCSNGGGVYIFGEPADIYFDNYTTPIVTNTPETEVYCGRDEEHGDDTDECAVIKSISPNPIEFNAVINYQVFQDSKPFQVIAISAYGEKTILASGLTSKVGEYEVELEFGLLEQGAYQLILESKNCLTNSIGFVKK